jgi:alpha-methylacyl-CoA racemase
MSGREPGSRGPLAGVRVIELAGIGPAPFCAMMLADSGATVLRVDRPTVDRPGPAAAGGPAGPAAASGPADPAAATGPANPAAATGPANPAAARAQRAFLNRGRQSVVLDLKQPRAVDALLRLVDAADVLLEGFRPGVTERMGVGPDACLRRNPRLVYARMTGWGQHGPLAATAGHDIGYIARTGALHALGRAGGPPAFPANLLGDFGGGGMVMAYGICAALVERAASGRGQVVDAAIVDGVASLLAMPLMLMAQGLWRDERGVNLLDGGVPWYDVYQTADGQWVAVGALEPRFYAALLAGLGVTDAPDRADPRNWPELRARFTARFAERTRDEWAATFAGTDACVEPVLSLAEAAADDHLTARGTYVTGDGMIQPAPAPRFSRTPGQLPDPAPVPGQHTIEALTAWGLPDAEALVACGAAVQA